MTASDERRHQRGRVVVLDGIAFDAVTESDVVSTVIRSSAAGVGGFILTPNVDILRQLRRGSLHRIADAADLVVADGMPLIWASRVMGDPLPERVAGSALLFSLARAAAHADRSVFLLGGAEDVAATGAEKLAKDIDGLRVAGWHFPPFGFDRDEAQLAAIDAVIRDAAPDIVFVGLGFPRQELLITRLVAEFPAVWFLGCGGSLTFAAGHISRAPQWMQRNGLEWVHRLYKEPRRLARRYLVEDAPYTAGLLVRSVARRGALRTRRAAQ